MTQPPPQGVGWYPYPLDETKRIYWDGTAWSPPVSVAASDSAAPTIAAPPIAPDKSDKGKKTGVAIGVIVLALIGLVMSQQPVNLFSGSGQVWTGVAVAGVGTAVSFFMGADRWVRVIAILCVAAGLANAIYIETQLSEKRNELSQIFNN